MTSYMLRRLISRGNTEQAASLLASAYNNATSPSALRTDREHQLQRERARLLRQRLYQCPQIAETQDGRWIASRLA
jgi:hypothetical protein